MSEIKLGINATGNKNEGNVKAETKIVKTTKTKSNTTKYTKVPVVLSVKTEDNEYYYIKTVDAVRDATVNGVAVKQDYKKIAFSKEELKGNFAENGTVVKDMADATFFENVNDLTKTTNGIKSNTKELEKLALRIECSYPIFYLAKTIKFKHTGVSAILK